jgi:hypothetical protein
MVTRELVYSELEQLEDEYLEQIYLVIQKLREAKKPPKKKSFFERLEEFQVDDGPGDLAVNHDLYISGEKKFEYSK